MQRIELTKEYKDKLDDLLAVAKVTEQKLRAARDAHKRANAALKRHIESRGYVAA